MFSCRSAWAKGGLLPMDRGGQEYWCGRRQRVSRDGTSGGGEAVRLGDAAEVFMEERAGPARRSSGSLEQAWAALVPGGLAGHCRLDGLRAGRLRVLVDSPAHLYELRLCSKELVARLRGLCPEARIREIRLAIG